MADISAEEAVRRNCEALIAGNIAQIFADMTPEAMAKLATAAPGGGMGGAMPQLTSFDIVSREEDGDDHLYDVQFHGDQNFGVKARWREIAGVWKLVDFDGYALEGESGTGSGEPGGGSAPTS